MNSVDLDVSGGKVITFPRDGGVIKYNAPNDLFTNTLFGTLIHNLVGVCTFTDEKNGIEASYNLGGAGRKYPKDYLVGEIKQHGKVVSKMFGSIMGYIEFDGERWWDGRRMANFEMTSIDSKFEKALPSDSKHRIDTIAYKGGDIDLAQVNKDKQENVQRAERKLREAAAKRREEGGPKIDYSVYPNHPLNPANM